jgi:SAM-dependent methyltransferase
VDERQLLAAAHARRQIEAGAHDRIAFREALLAVPPHARDAWFDRVLGLATVPDDGSELPRGCVPYLPCGVDALLEVIEHAEIGPDDVFVDIGSGVGRATALVHLLTGAGVIGIEIQADLVDAAREVASAVSSSIANVHGDAAELTGWMMNGSVFFLYCPFSGERLAQVLSDLEAIAETRPIRVCCVDLPLPACHWLAASSGHSSSVTVHRSTQYDAYPWLRRTNLPSGL